MPEIKAPDNAFNGKPNTVPVTFLRSMAEGIGVPKSAAFIRIKADVLGIVRDVPRGRVCTDAAIGRYWDVMARHVAYILATLTDDEWQDVPWHRVVAESGAINKTKHGRGAERRAALEAEGGGDHTRRHGVRPVGSRLVAGVAARRNRRCQ